MSRDAQGNDLEEVAVPVTGAMCLVPYAPENVITNEMIANTKANPELPDAYDRTKAALGLITSDGGPQDSIDQDDPLEFFQQGYAVNATPVITTAFTLAEDSELSRRVSYGSDPDENGVYGVDTFTPDEKWMAYYEETYKNGRVLRRAGVVQVTGNEPGQSERGSVKGRALTVTWQNDPLYGNHKFIESVYDPAATAAVRVTSVALDKGTTSVAQGAKVKLTPKFTPTNATDQSGTWSSDNGQVATVDNDGNVSGVKAGQTVVTFISKDGSKPASCAVTVTAPSA